MERKRRNALEGQWWILTVINGWGFFPAISGFCVLTERWRFMVWMLHSSVEEFVLVGAKRADCATRHEVKGKHQPDTR